MTKISCPLQLQNFCCRHIVSIESLSDDDIVVVDGVTNHISHETLRGATLRFSNDNRIMSIGLHHEDTYQRGVCEYYVFPWKLVKYHNTAVKDDTFVSSVELVLIADEKKEKIAVIRDIYKKEAMVTAAVTEIFCCAVGSS
jgi:hypothetical protein